MTTRKPSPRPRPITLDQARADDLLLDALGRGEPAPGDDEIAALLATWRAELAEDADIEAESEEDQPALAPVVRPAFGSWRVRLVAAVALVVALAGGTTLAAADAGPGSPLWPVTKIVNPDHAGAVTAQTTLDQARAAINQGRPADARRLLDQAQNQIAQVRDPGTAQRLRDQLDTLRRTLAAVVPVLPGSGPVVVPAPGGTPTVGGAGSAPGGGGTGAGGGATNGTGGGTGPTSGTGGNGGGGTGGGGILPTGIPSAPVPSVLPSLPGVK